MSNVNSLYIISIIILFIITLFILYYIINKVGARIYTTRAVITERKHTPGSINYIARIAGGRTWTQAQKQSNFYVISLDLGNEKTSILVNEEKFNQFEGNDSVEIKYRRTRITKRIEVLEILPPPR